MEKIIDKWAYLCFLEILKESRETMCKHVKNLDATLYMALFKEYNSPVQKIKFQMYELKWLHSIWKSAVVKAESTSEYKGEMQKKIIQFSLLYSDFLKKFEHRFEDISIIETKLDALKLLVTLDETWQNNLEMLELQFEKDKRDFELKLKELAEENKKNGCCK